MIQEHYDWQDKLLPQVVEIIGEHYFNLTHQQSLKTIKKASEHDDMTQNTDLALLTTDEDKIRIAVRLRRPEYKNYAGDITFRYTTQQGSLGDWDKMIDGYGDIMFFGHVDDKDNVWYWHIIDLKKLRSLMIRNSEIYKNRKIIRNGDGSSFVVINFKQIAESIINGTEPTYTEAEYEQATQDLFKLL
jgi:hypothetical protein